MWWTSGAGTLLLYGDAVRRTGAVAQLAAKFPYAVRRGHTTTPWSGWGTLSLTAATAHEGRDRVEDAVTLPVSIRKLEHSKGRVSDLSHIL